MIIILLLGIIAAAVLIYFAYKRTSFPTVLTTMIVFAVIVWFYRMFAQGIGAWTALFDAFGFFVAVFFIGIIAKAFINRDRESR